MRLFPAIIAAAVVGVSCPANAQDYLPLPPLAESPFGPIPGSPVRFATDTVATEVVVTDAPLRCATPPTPSVLGSAQFKQTTLDRDAAAEAGLPVGSFSSSLVKKVLVQDWTRTATCLATDGRTELIYGQGIRLIAASERINIEGDLTLGMLAANSTLNNQTSNVQVNIIGFNDQQLTNLGTQIFGPINVDRFATVDDLVKKMVTRASSLPGGSVQRLGVIFPSSSAGDHAIAAFALQQIKDSKSCEATKARLPNLTAAQSLLIASIYGAMEAACDGNQPEPVSRARAGAALGKIRVSL
jgi:hypothetical protein